MPTSSIKRTEFATGTEFEDELKLLNHIADLAPGLFKEVTGKDKPMCINIDLYSGFIYKMLRIPEDIFTPLFATARLAGWCAHRMEELYTGGRIIRPAYKSLSSHTAYTPIADRAD